MPFVVRTNCLQQKPDTIFRFHEQTWGGRGLDWGGTSSYTVVDVLATGNSQAKPDPMVGTARQWLASTVRACSGPYDALSDETGADLCWKS